MFEDIIRPGLMEKFQLASRERDAAVVSFPAVSVFGSTEVKANV